MKQVFVYGTLMQGMENHFLIQPFTAAVAPAVVNGARLYHLEYGYPALVFSGKAAQVRGELVELADMEKALAVLDQLEDYYGAGHPDNLYERVLCSAEFGAGTAVEAYVYVWSKPEQLTALGQLIPSGCWRTWQQMAQNLTRI